MRVFISWSGKRSLHIATAIRDWLPNVLQAVRPFISSQDIRKGTRGNVVISKRLKEANVGIICLTPENMTAPWILYEAGALSKLLSAYVCTYLWQLEPSDIEPPLGQFQHTKHNKRDVKALVEAVNSQLPEGRGLSRHRLDVAFEQWWPILDKQIKATPERPKEEPLPKKRSDDSKLDELLTLVRRALASETPEVSPPPFRRPIGKPSRYISRVDLAQGHVLALLNKLAHGQWRILTNDDLAMLVKEGWAVKDDEGDILLTMTGISKREELREKFK